MIEKNRIELLDSRGTVPWLSYEAILWLYEHIRDDWTIFEWGSGASTFWFASRCSQVVSVEHNEAWSEIVRRLLSQRITKNVELWCEPEQLRYVNAADEYDDGRFDLIVVDGFSDWRVDCVEKAIGKVKPGGYLILDNSERKHISPACDSVPETWTRIDLDGRARRDPTRAAENLSQTVKTQTTIWRRPHERP